MASLEFAKAMTMCHQISQMEDVTNGKEHEGALERKDLFTTRAETVLRPLFRYCQYELKEAGQEMVNEPILSSTNAATNGSAATDSIHYRGQEIAIDNKELRVLLLKLSSYDTTTTTTSTKKSGDKRETIFLSSLSTIDDALGLVQTSMQTLAQSKAGPAVNAKRQQYELWRGYLQAQKIHLVMEHTQGLLEEIPLSGHAERAHLYDSLLQHAKSLLQLPRPTQDGSGEEEDEFALQAQATILRIRAFKSFHMAMYYYQPRQQYPHAYTLLEHSKMLTKRAMEEIAACNQDMVHAQEYLDALQELQDVTLVGATACVEAALYLSKQQQQQQQATVHVSTKGGVGGGTKSSIGGNAGQKSNRCLLQRLDDLDAGSVLADVPLAVLPMPCKPVFYDLAYNHAVDVSEATAVLENYIQDHSQAPESSSSSGGGLFGWFSSSK
jgi:hypothetical protein